MPPPSGSGGSERSLTCPKDGIGGGGWFGGSGLKSEPMSSWLLCGFPWYISLCAGWNGIARSGVEWKSLCISAMFDLDAEPKNRTLWLPCSETSLRLSPASFVIPFPVPLTLLLLLFISATLAYTLGVFAGDPGTDGF